MEVAINIKDLCKYAMFETDGILLRNKILETWEKDPTSTFMLDFFDVKMYATMFFNASIGWFVLRYGAEETARRITTCNLTLLGQETWKHSFENAIEVAENPEYQEILARYDANEE